MSNALAHAYEIWQVDFLWKGADRMFDSLKPVKGFSSGRATYQKSTFHIFLHLHTGIYHQKTKDRVPRRKPTTNSLP
jgi:hypothetical protein